MNTMKLLLFASCILSTLVSTIAQSTVTHTITVPATYRFSSEISDDSPSSGDVSAVTTKTTQFFRRVLASAFAQTYNDVTCSMTNKKKIDHYSIVITYKCVAKYNKGGAATPTLSDSTNAMLSGYEPDDYMFNFVRPAGGIFDDTDYVVLSVSGASSSEPSSGGGSGSGGGSSGGGSSGGSSGGGSSGGGSGSDSGMDACFSGVTTVQVQGKGMVTMENLKVGDMVHVGKEVYSPVYGFGHLDRENKYEYWQVHTEPLISFSGGKILAPLELSDEHLVFIEGQGDPIRADHLQVGEVLCGQDCDYLYQVTELKRITRTGAYLPLTAEGTIMANGIFASTYVSSQENAETWWLTSIISEQALFGLFVSPLSLMCGTMGMTQICSHPTMYESQTGVWHWLRLGQNLANTWNFIEAWHFCGIMIAAIYLFHTQVRVRVVQLKQKNV